MKQVAMKRLKKFHHEPNKECNKCHLNSNVEKICSRSALNFKIQYYVLQLFNTARTIPTHTHTCTNTPTYTHTRTHHSKTHSSDAPLANITWTIKVI